MKGKGICRAYLTVEVYYKLIDLNNGFSESEAKDGGCILCVGTALGAIELYRVTSTKTDLWTVLQGRLQQPVTCLAIQDNGVLLASGCSKGTGIVNIWSLEDGTLLRTRTGAGGVHSLAWVGNSGLAVCFGRSKVSFGSYFIHYHY